MKFLLKSSTRQALFGLTLFLIAVLIVFLPVSGKYMALNAPDSPPYFSFPFRTLKIEELLASGSFTPHNLYWLLFNPLYAHELSYILDTLVLVLGGFFYLRSQRVQPLAAWFGGLALGFSGYTFTLFSAGHRGYFHMFPCAVFAFGLIARGFATRRLIWFAWLGLVFAWGVPHQPDVLLLVGALAGAYVLWRSCKRDANNSEGIVRRIVAVWPRFIVSLLLLVLAGWGGIRTAVTTQIEARDVQIAGAGKSARSDAGEGKTPQKLEERWLFATGWSMPPEDVLEFFVPGIFGNDSFQPPYPYWGRLGRPDDTVFQKGRMMPNYRQHTLYLGLVPLLFAIYAVVTSRRREDGEDKSAANDPADLSDTPFWIGAWVVCLLLAFGSYTPLYRLFYALPYMDYIRAPVKFLHLVELATAVLAGYGAQRFFFEAEKRGRKPLLWLTIGTFGVLAIGALVAWSLKPSVVGHIAALGMTQAAEPLSGYMVSNIMRALLVAALLVAMAWGALSDKLASKRVLLLCATVVLAVLDQALVAGRYVRVLEVASLYRTNAVIKALQAKGGGRVPNVVNYATQNSWQDWFSMSLALHGLRNLTPTADDMATPYGKLFAALQPETLRLWQVLQARTVIIPWQSGEGLVRAGVLRPLLAFGIEHDAVRQTETPSEKSFMLAEVAKGSDKLLFTQSWQGNMTQEKQVEALAAIKGVVSDAPEKSGAVDAGAQARMVAARGHSGAFATKVVTDAKGEGLLIFDERLDVRQEVLIDGKPAEKYIANAIWPAALVPAGTHEVTLRLKLRRGTYFMGILVMLVMVGWSFWRREKTPLFMVVRK